MIVGKSAVFHTKVILVHGTWARGFFARKEMQPPLPERRRWFDIDSPFYNSLLQELKNGNAFVDEFLSFRWSGKNSVRARHEAAKDLAASIRANSTDSSSHYLLICHSHGGNVAIKALDYLDADLLPRVHVVTLATPFIRAFVIDANDKRLNFYKWYLVYTASLVEIALVYPFVMGGGMDSAWVMIFPAGCFVFSFLLTGLIIQATLGPFDSNLLGSRMPYLSDLVDGTNYSSHRLRGSRLLVLRGADDEATFAIVAGALFGRAWLTTSKPYIFLMQVLLISGLPVVPLFLFNDVAGALLAILGFGVVAPLIANLCRAVFGWEFAFGSTRLELAVDSTPDVTAENMELTVETLPARDTAGKLRHCLYERDGVTRVIAKWFVHRRRDTQL